MHWSAQPLEPARFNNSDPPPKARVFLRSGAVLEGRRPFIQQDSLIWSLVRAGGVAEHQGIPLSQIAKAEIWKHDTEATVMLVAAVTVFLIVGIAAASANSVRISI